MNREKWFTQFVTDAMRSGLSALEAFHMAQTAMQTNDRELLTRRADFEACRRINAQNTALRWRPSFNPAAVVGDPDANPSNAVIGRGRYMNQQVAPEQSGQKTVIV